MIDKVNLDGDGRTKDIHCRSEVIVIVVCFLQRRYVVCIVIMSWYLQTKLKRPVT